MPIYLGGEVDNNQKLIVLDELSPRQIVAELDKYIVGQVKAKKAVAVAVRNRVRRQKLPAEIARDVLPKNILMIGSTGIGKTEIARRLARLANSPFIKIEASKFTEVGYVGRDVESMIRDLTEIAVEMTKQNAFESVLQTAETNVEEKILDILLPASSNSMNAGFSNDIEITENSNRTREKLRQQYRSGKFDDKIIEIEAVDRSNTMIDFVGGQGMEEMGVNIKDMFGNLFPAKTVRRRVKVSEAKKFMLRDEQESLIDNEEITRQAIEKTESAGIIFLDEMDKIAGRESGGAGPDVSREGVQRDLLPIVEGTTVNTRHGMVNTEHILFIAAGAFHVAKPSDLIPELQGRFPIRVELESLSFDDLKQILTQPKNSLIKQYQALLKTEEIELRFTDEAISRLAEMTQQINQTTENIGARRLHTLIEKLLEEISFAGSELEDKNQTITAEYVDAQLGALIEDQNLRHYIL